MASPPESLGVAHINEHSRTHFGGLLKCDWTPEKGRILKAAREFALGDVILSESPLHIVQEDTKCDAFRELQSLIKTRETDFDYDALWYWCALNSLTDEELQGVKHGGWPSLKAESQYNLLLLHHDKITESSSAAEVLVQELCPSADPLKLERLIQIWVLNCFEYSDSPLGYSTYFFSSFMSHSCFPNAAWHYDGADHVLRARRKILVGDEVCITYLPEDGLLNCAPTRRWELSETKRFWCTCERCAGAEDLSRGLLCPGCHKGTVFARVPVRGPAESNELLMSELVGCPCRQCGLKLSEAQAKALALEEAELRALIDAGGAPKLREAAALEAKIDASFSQHVLADLSWERIADAYGKLGRRRDQRRLHMRRQAFHEQAYPELNGAHAWLLEAAGDARLKTGKNRAGEEAEPEPDPVGAKSLYDASHRILSLMFGEQHEYVQQVECKRQKILKAGAPGKRA